MHQKNLGTFRMLVIAPRLATPVLHQLQLQRREVTDIQSVKTVLTEAWDNIPFEVIQRATGSWLNHLQSTPMLSGPRKAL